jgi:hypothetical protein
VFFLLFILQTRETFDGSLQIILVLK